MSISYFEQLWLSLRWFFSVNSTRYTNKRLNWKQSKWKLTVSENRIEYRECVWCYWVEVTWSPKNSKPMNFIRKMKIIFERKPQYMLNAYWHKFPNFSLHILRNLISIILWRKSIKIISQLKLLNAFSFFPYDLTIFLTFPFQFAHQFERFDMNSHTFFVD